MITDCLLALNKLIPQTLDGISELEMRQKAISAVIEKVYLHRIEPEQQEDLTKIRALAQRAKEMGLLSKEGEYALQRIAKKCRAIGISLVTSPLNYTLLATDGEVKVNREVLTKNSNVLKKIIEDMGANEGIPVELSKKAVEFLMYCLHAPKDEVIVLPDDESQIQDLIRFAAGFGFNKLLKKLENPVAKYLDTHRENALTDDWLSVFYVVKQSNLETAVKWARVLMPDFIEKYSIPVDVSTFPYDFEVSIGHRNVFFNQEVRDVIKCLPIMLLIKSDKELQFFIETCKKNKMQSLLPLKVFCRFRVLPEIVKQINEIAKSSNIQLTIEQSIVPLGTKFFGKEHWEKYIGHVDDLPLPDELVELLNSEIILRTGDRTGKKWKDIFMLFLLPATVNGVPLTSRTFIELVKNPQNGGHPGKFQFIHPEMFYAYSNDTVEQSAWVLLTMNVYDGQKLFDYTDFPNFPGCGKPAFLPAQVGIMTHFIDTGERLFPEVTYQRVCCGETIRKVDQTLHLTLGGFGKDGLGVSGIIDGPWATDHCWGNMRVFTPRT